MVRGIFSHLANAAAEDTAVQLARFATALSIAESAGLNPEIVHIASTAGALRVPESRNNLVRIGIGIYGLSPFEDASSAQLGLTPAQIKASGEQPGDSCNGHTGFLAGGGGEP